MTTPAWVVQPWGGRAVTATRLSRARARRRRHAVVAAALALAAVAAGTWAAVAAGGPTAVASSGGVSLWRTTNGLAISAPFDGPLPIRDLEDTFSFSGSASPGVGYAQLGRAGLWIGVHPHPDRFEGWFAVTRAAFPATGAYHVHMAKPPGDVSAADAQGEAVFAVQTGTTKLNGLINYVVVASDSTRGTTTWTIGYAHGHVADAHLETLARLRLPVGASAAQDVTLTTDGRRRLSVWFGDRLVYSSDRLDLDIAPPFQPYLEVQSRRIPYVSRFRDLWVTTETSLTVSAPSGARLALVEADGRTVAKATAQHGTAHLVLAPPQAHGTATLVVRQGGHRVALGPFAYAGGDHYRLSGEPG